MITIKTAKRSDLPAIQALQAKYAKMQVSASDLNNRDVALKAIDTETGAIVGFVWGGLMSQNTVMFVDKVAVDPAYTGHGVCQALYAELYKRVIKLGVKSMFGMIARDEFHDRSAINALKFAWGAQSTPYTLVYVDVDHMIKEIERMRAA